MNFKLYSIFICSLFFLVSCNGIFSEKITGNGIITSQQRNISAVKSIKTMGDFDVIVGQDLPEGLTIQADENVMPYIVTEVDNDGTLKIRVKNHFRLDTQTRIQVKVQVENIEGLYIAGSGNITGIDKFTGSNELHAEIAGSGHIQLSVNTPKIYSKIAGTGTIQLQGETKDEVISIAGNGVIKCANLKAENVKIKIAGSGDVYVFSANQLDISIAGSGSVYYTGNPSITQHIAGSGNIKKVD
ncbi:MAG: DUF2807 domain-containing protein [Bacteroidota bacterium]|nr:DUF2807 domain-containing protein [Bacteroidota bacterium]